MPLSITRDWIDFVSLLFSGLLVAIGTFGVVYAIRTLKAIERQAKANEGQLAEIKAAGQQTDRMIEHVATQAEAAKEAAAAAKKSADTLISSERAWIIPDVRWKNIAGRFLNGTRGDGTHYIIAGLRLTCRNQGRSPAWITEKRIRLEIAEIMAPKPDLTGAELWCDIEPLAVGEESVWEVDSTTEGLPGFGKAILIYGTVKYRDVFTAENETRESWFGYRILPSDRLERLAHPEYNKYT